ncbi:MAG TPA: hypothetical protein P5266_06710 [Candidatus Fermentibacter sp.]|nr:hypothetical protein [Candidatus Fermentibacter sp.]
MSMERAFLNYDEGFGCCCWSAPSAEDLAALFDRAGAAHEKIVPVEEMTA